MNIVNVSSSTTLTSGTEARCDSTSAAFTLTFPTSPTDGDLIRVVDWKRKFDVHAVTVNVGSKTINGSSTMVLSIPGTTYEFTYLSASNEWLVFFNQIFSPNVIQSVTASGPITASIADNNLTLALSGAISGTVTGLSDGQFLVAEGTTWVNKSLTSTDLGITDNPTTVALSVNKGNLTETGSSVLQITNGTNAVLKNTTIQVNQSTASTSGYLSSTDWSTFNNKIGTITTTTPALSISGNAINLANQAANKVLAGAASGGSSLPAFRSLVSADILPAILSGTFTQGMIAVYNNANFLADTALTWLSNKLTVAGLIATQGIQIDETVAAQTCGTTTLGTNGIATVLTTAVAANSRIFLSYGAKSGISSATLNSQNIVVGTSFRIQSSSVFDRSVVYWLLINPAS